jgi:Tfp pilus assembly protein PilF
VEVLAERRAAGTLFNLETINLGFIRPHSSQDWTLAYCQAELYAEYMLDQYGPDALAQMLTAYADNLTTPAALERSFHVPVADFEQGYQAFLQKTLADAAPSSAAAPALDFAALVKAQADKPHDADLAGRLALEYLRRKNLPQARELVAPLMKQNPKDQLAAYVMARLKLSIGENDEALALLRGALDREQPQDNLLGLLAGLELKAEKYDAAAELYELGAKREPHNLQWPQLLARVYLLSKNNAKLGPVLARLADADADDAPLRKKLAQLAWDRHDAEATAKWALQAIYIDVQDGDSHRLLALALTAKKDWSRAFEEYDAAVQLLPQDLQLRYTWAEAALAAGQPAQAKLVLDKLLVLEPQFPGAKELAARIAQAAHR